jgi:excisionase family DNA binding protein
MEGQRMSGERECQKAGERSERLILRAGEVCCLLGWSEGQLYESVRRGQLPARRLGRRLVFVKAELLKHLSELPLAATPSAGKEGE